MSTRPFSILDAAQGAPDALALLVGDDAFTFAALANRVAAVIPALTALGLPEASAAPVALVGSSDLQTLLCLYALLEIGQPVALIHPRLSAPERVALLALLGRERPLDPLALALAAAEAPASHDAVSSMPSDVDDERCLAVLFTSGTTGQPKGVVLSRRAFVASARASARNLGFFEGDRWLLGLPIAHVGGLSVITRCLAARRTVVVPKEIAEGRRLDGARLAYAITALGATIVSVVPTQLEWLLAEGSDFRGPKSLRVVLLGGAPASPALLERAAARAVPVLTTYGLTEACSQVTTQPRGTVNRGDLGAGRPLEGVEIRLADGKVQLRGPTLFSGYFPARDRRPDEWFETDDCGRFDEHGCLHLLGRSSEKVITGGENVFPAEVEPVLERCPGIRQALVFGVADAAWGEILAAAIVAGPNGPPADELLAKHVAENLAPHRRPRRIAVVEAFLVTPAGKIDRTGTAAKALAILRPVEKG